MRAAVSPPRASRPNHIYPRQPATGQSGPILTEQRASEKGGHLLEAASDHQRNAPTSAQYWAHSRTSVSAASASTRRRPLEVGAGPPASSPSESAATASASWCDGGRLGPASPAFPGSIRSLGGMPSPPGHALGTLASEKPSSCVSFVVSAQPPLFFSGGMAQWGPGPGAEAATGGTAGARRRARLFCESDRGP